MRRTINALQSVVLEYRVSETGSDAQMAAAIQANLEQAEAIADQALDSDGFLFESLDTALTDAFFAAIALFLLAIERGERQLLDQGLGRLREGLVICSEMNLLPQWWAHRVATHPLPNLSPTTFHKKIPILPPSREPPPSPHPLPL